MANVPITDLTALGARPSTDDYFVIVDSSEALDADKTKKVKYQYVGPTFLTTPLTSTSWDGDSFSTTAKTKIDLSAVFGAPAGIQAVIFHVGVQDSSASSYSAWFGLSPNDTADSLASQLKVYGGIDDATYYENVTIPCDSNGDVYYQCRASGAGTMDVWLEIWGYWL